MTERGPTVVLIVRPTTDRSRRRQLLRWLHLLLPAAMLLVSEVPLAGTADADPVITIDADSIESGPLSLADTIVRAGVRNA